MSLTEIAIKRPSLIVVIYTVLTFLGLFGYSQLGYELIPKFSQPVVTITTAYPGASPAEVENSVTKRIEDGIASMENVKDVRSISAENFSLVIIDLNASANIDLALQDAQRKVNAMVSRLPKEIKTPVLGKISPDEAPIIRLGVTGKLASTELYDIVDQRISPALARVEGVGKVDIIGGEQREIRINVNLQKMEAYNLSILQVTQAIQKANLDFPTGKIKSIENQNLIRLAGKFKNLADLENTVVASDRNGSPVYLKEVAEVQDTQRETETLTRVDGVNSIGIMIRKQSDANAVKVKELVFKELANIEKTYNKEGLKFQTAQDTTQFTLESAEAVIHDLELAVVLVALVMLLFLHSLRNAVIVMISIPASLITTFFGIYLFGFTLNLMTLLALSLVVGILVDDSIVVLENIYRHLEMGKDRRTAALDGRNEIGFTAMSITLVDVVVFLPIALTDGLISNILRQFSLVVVVSTLLSLFVSFTITPLLASRFSKVERLNPNTWIGGFVHWFEDQLEKLTENYIKILKWSLRHKILTLGMTLALFFGSFALVGYGFIGTEFFSMGDRGEFILQIELPKDATVEQTNLVTQKIEKVIFNREEVTGVFTTIGATSDFIGGSNAPFKAEVNVKLVDKNERSLSADFYANEIKNELIEKIPGVVIRSAPIGILGSAMEAPVQYVLTGPNLDTLIRYAEKIAEKSKKVAGATDIRLSVEDGNPEINVKVNKERLAELGLSMDIVGATMQTAFNGNTDNKYKPGEYEYDINVKLDAFDRRNQDDIENLAFVNNQGQLIKMKQFAEIAQTTGPSKLERESRMPSVTVEMQAIGRPSGTVGDDVRKIIDAMNLPSEIRIGVDGDIKRQNESGGSLGFALLASILFVYLIMVALYDSYIYPFVVLFSIPVAIIGALLALALTLQSLNIFSMLGMIMLIGLVAKNAILLVDRTNQMKADGETTYEALIDAGRTRLRPILMTTIAMVIGMLPIALASGAGAEWKNGLAWALIGGLTSSMLLTLVVVPVVFTIVDSLIARFNRLFRKKKAESEVAY
jgi:hydrophobic/amphiphilic exporter-1 (mainly G- bacteria), HAE1 family